VAKSAFTIESEEQPEWDFSHQVDTFVEVTLDEDFNWDFGEVPDWLDYELCEVGFGCVFDVHDREKFALENGLCIGQTFVVVVCPPRYSQDYWGEWDVDYEWMMWCVMPLPPEEHLKTWTEWLARSEA
jgi:hypothetical protein